MNNNQILQHFFNTLNQSGILYAVLRNYETLPNSLGGSDLDIWIKQSEADLFFKLIKKLITEQEAQLVSFIYYKNCQKICLLNLNFGIQIDVFLGDLIYKRGILIFEDTIIKNILKYNNINILNPDLANIISLLKEILNNGKAEQKYIISIYESKHIYTKEYLFDILKNFSKNFIIELEQSIHKNKLEKAASILQKSAGYRNKTILHFFKDILKLKRFLRPPGYFIAVLGTDGSGKSTIINTIMPWLKEPFHNGVFYRHLRPALFPDLASLLCRRNKGHQQTVVSNPHSGRTAGFFESLIRLAYYSLDYTLGFFKMVSSKIYLKSCVFIFDRYYYDYYIDQKRSCINLPKWIIRTIELFIPAPDLILCLGGDPNEIYNRKPETSLEEVRRQTSELRKFCNSRKNAVWIDTTTSKEESIFAAKQAILNMMSNRFKY